MHESQDYYQLLGVSRDATNAEIRRAFRARAKFLHPDSEQAHGNADAEQEFRALSEAYEALKDVERRSAYDEELDLSRQVMAREAPRRKRPRIFMSGLAAGLALAVLGFAAKTYLGPAIFSAAPKSQESLNPVQPVTAPDVQPQEVQAATAPAAASPPQPPAVTTQAESGNRQASAGQEPAPPGPVRSPPPAAGEPQQAPPPPAPAKAGPGGLSSSPRPGQPGLAEAILALDAAMGKGDNGSASYQLAALIASTSDRDVLMRAAARANRTETWELIDGRLAELGESPAGTPAVPGIGAARIASAAPVTTPPDQPEPAPDAPRAAVREVAQEAGLIEVSVGPPGSEKLLRLKPGNGRAESFTDCRDCPEMVVIPAGQFAAPSMAGPEGPDAEPRARGIRIASPFAVSKFEVTIANWHACVAEKGCLPTGLPPSQATIDLPATRLSWFDAKAYAAWLSNKTGKRYRLLTGKEWDYAARAGGSAFAEERTGGASKFPDQPSGYLGLFRVGERLRPVHSLAPNPWGLTGLHGNALEWVEDCWHGAPAYGPLVAATLPGSGGSDCGRRAVRGGPFAAIWDGAASYGGGWRNADARGLLLGLRVARDITPPRKLSAHE